MLELGGWSIEQQLFDWICNNIPKGSTILELGSGNATQNLSEVGYKMYSIENNLEYVGKYNSTYIHCPLKIFNKIWEWYDIDKEKLPKEYSLLLIDGPSYAHRREMLNHMDLFKTDIPIVIDDCQTNECTDLANKISAIVNRPVVYEQGKEKKWAIIK